MNKIISFFVAPLLVFVFAAACSKSDDTHAGNAPVPSAITPAPSAPTVSTSTNNLITTASGLQYEVLKHGSGTVSPKPSDMVKVNYIGVLLNGTKFDSSSDHGGPAEFRLNQVITGWTEGLQLMKVGDKFRFVIPSNLGYGEASPPGIPPNSTLVFEVELLAIE
jgi:FKBP-type peptidyl-prolyl cis-trans isomerase